MLWMVRYDVALSLSRLMMAASILGIKLALTPSHMIRPAA